MEELAKLEAERGTPGYVSADGTAKGGVETVDGKKGKQGRAYCGIQRPILRSKTAAMRS